LLDRPGLDLVDRIGLVTSSLLAPVGVGLEKIDEVVGILDLGFDLERLGLATLEHIAAEPIAGHELGGSFAHRLKPLQPEGQPRGGPAPRRPATDAHLQSLQSYCTRAAADSHSLRDSIPSFTPRRVYRGLLAPLSCQKVADGAPI